jgi:hypothetical protein
LTVLFCNRLTNSLFRHFMKLQKRSWFRCQLFDTVWWARWHPNWNIANRSLTDYRMLRSRPASLHQKASWICCVPSSTRIVNILLCWTKPGFMGCSTQV